MMEMLGNAYLKVRIGRNVVFTRLSPTATGSGSLAVRREALIIILRMYGFMKMVKIGEWR